MLSGDCSECMQRGYSKRQQHSFETTRSVQELPRQGYSCLKFTALCLHFVTY